MELRHLRYFVAIAEAPSFRKAAERLHLTRPALSKQLKELEDEVGVRLLDRNTAQVTLTEAGAIYLHEAREILERAEQAGVLARETAQGHRGVLTIGEPGAGSALPHGGTDLFSRAISQGRRGLERAPAP